MLLSIYEFPCIGQLLGTVFPNFILKGSPKLYLTYYLCVIIQVCSMQVYDDDDDDDDDDEKVDR